MKNSLNVRDLEAKYGQNLEILKRGKINTNLSGFDRQFAAREPLEMLLQQSLRIILSDLLARHFTT